MELNSSGQNTALALLFEGIADESHSVQPIQGTPNNEFPTVLEEVAQAARPSAVLQDDKAPTLSVAPVISLNEKSQVDVVPPALTTTLKSTQSAASVSTEVAPAVENQAVIALSRQSDVPLKANLTHSLSSSNELIPLTPSTQINVAQNLNPTSSINNLQNTGKNIEPLLTTPVPPPVVSRQAPNTPVVATIATATPVAHSEMSGNIGHVENAVLNSTEAEKSNRIGRDTPTVAITQQHSLQKLSIPVGRDLTHAQHIELPKNVIGKLKEIDTAGESRPINSTVSDRGRSYGASASPQLAPLAPPRALAPISALEMENSIGVMAPLNVQSPPEKPARTPVYMNVVAALNAAKETSSGSQESTVASKQKASLTPMTAPQHTTFTVQPQLNQAEIHSPVSSNPTLEETVSDGKSNIARSVTLEAVIKDGISANREVQPASVRTDTLSPAAITSTQPTEVNRADKLQSPVTSLPLLAEGSELPAKLGQQVRFMAENGVQSVVMRVNPTELGPVRIEVALDKEQLSVNISATQTLAREMLESALPRLRDTLMLHNNERVEVNVSQQNREGSQLPADQHAQHRQRQYSQTAERMTESDAETVYPSVVAETESSGRIDAYV